MEILIDSYVYDELKKHGEKNKVPMSMVATKAIKQYLNAE